MLHTYSYLQNLAIKNIHLYMSYFTAAVHTLGSNELKLIYERWIIIM